jgi:hypothetical protein
MADITGNSRALERAFIASVDSRNIGLLQSIDIGGIDPSALANFFRAFTGWITGLKNQLELRSFACSSLGKFMLEHGNVFECIQYFVRINSETPNPNQIDCMKGILFGLIPLEYYQMSPDAIYDLFKLGYQLCFNQHPSVYRDREEQIQFFALYSKIMVNPDAHYNYYLKMREIMQQLLLIAQNDLVQNVKDNLRNILCIGRNADCNEQLPSFDVIAYFHRIIREKQEPKKSLFDVADDDYVAFKKIQRKLRIDDHILQNIVSYLNIDVRVALMRKYPNFFICIRPRPFNMLSDIEGYLKNIIASNFNKKEGGITTILGISHHYTSKGISLCKHFTLFGQREQEIVVMQQIIRRIEKFVTNQQQLRSMLIWMFGEEQTVINNAISKPNGLIVKISDGEITSHHNSDIYSVLRHENEFHFTRIIRAMLLGIIDASRCTKLNAGLLNDLLSFAIDAEEHRLSYEWGYRISLPCIRNILLFDGDVEPVIFQDVSGCVLYSGYKISNDGIVPGTGIEYFAPNAIKSPIMSLMDIQTLLDTSWNNLRQDMQLMLNILSFCENREQQDTFINALNNMRSNASGKVDETLKSLNYKFNTINNLCNIVRPHDIGKDIFPYLRNKEFTELLNTWAERLRPKDPALIHRSSRP